MKIWFDAHRWATEFAIDNIQDYVETMEVQFDTLRKLEKEKIPQNQPPGLSEEDYAEWQAEINFFEERYERDFPSKIRYSFLVLLYIVFETRLRAACDEITRRGNLDLKEKELKGSPIERARIFLEKVAKVAVKDQVTWQSIVDFQKVRDCIVHLNGRVENSRDKERIQNLCNKNLGLSIDAGSLIVGHKYCSKTLETVRQFFDRMFTEAGFGPSDLRVE